MVHCREYKLWKYFVFRFRRGCAFWDPFLADPSTDHELFIHH